MKSVDTTETADWLNVFENLFNASCAVFEDGKPSVWDYSNPDNFTSLWKTLEDGRVQKASCVLIIWSKTPSDESLLPVNTSEHISPLHWAACAAKTSSQIRVCILDLNPSAHRGEYLYEHYLTCDKSRLPWLRVVQAAHLFGEEQTSGEFHADVGPVEIEAVKKRLFPQLAPRRNLIRAGHFVDRIREELTSPKNPENRHAIANIIGPVILLGSRFNERLFDDSRSYYIKNNQVTNYQPHQTKIDHRRPLHSILRVSQLAPELANASTFVERVRKELGEVLPKNYKLRITFVDDQWSHGWYEWIKSMFPSETAFTICPDPYFLLNRIESALSKRAQAKDARFRLDLSPPMKSSGDYLDILLLDLRLFSGDLQGEEEFYGKLEHLCARFSGQLGANKAGSASRLTLLANLTALTDFSLPIVLFSSTTSRETISQLAHHRNVLTSFTKPPFLSATIAQSIPALHERFARTFFEAIRWCDLRLKCQELLALNEGDVSESTSKQPSRRTRLHIELFIDETLRTSSAAFEVGGVFAVFDSLQDADEFDDLAVSNGLRYFNGSLFFPHSPTHKILVKGEDTGAKELADAAKSFSKPLNLGFVQLRLGETRKGSETKDIQDDNQFHILLSALIELFLAESLREISHHYQTDMRNVSVSVYVATRMSETKETGNHTYQRNIEIHSFRDGNMIRSFGGRDAFPIVHSILRRHGLTDIKVERAVGICLPYEGERKSEIDRTVSRTDKQVFDFDPARDVEPLNEIKLPWFACGVVLRVPVTGQGSGSVPEFFFVAVPGIQDDVFCHKVQCQSVDLQTLRRGDYICLEVKDKYSQKRGRWELVGESVRQVAKSDYLSWYSKTFKVSEAFLDGRSVADFRPDYRALHYVADQIMRSGCANFSESLKQATFVGQFDENYEIPLQLSVEASRRLDQGYLGDALKMFSFDVLPQRSYQRPTARILIGKRIAAALGKCSAEQLAAALPTRSNANSYNRRNLWKAIPPPAGS